MSAAADTPYLPCLCCGWQCTYANGDVYEGNWFRDQRQGDGVLRLAPDNTLGEAVYTGPFDHDERCGTGECTYAPWTRSISVRATHVANCVAWVWVWLIHSYRDGGKYVGQWRDSMRHGTGSMTYGDDTSYEGDWIENDRHGQGVCKFGNGDEYRVRAAWQAADAKAPTADARCNARWLVCVFVCVCVCVCVTVCLCLCVAACGWNIVGIAGKRG